MDKRPRIDEFQDQIARIYPHLPGRVRSVTIQVTDDCNLRCSYCYQINKKHHIIDFETAKKFLLRILNCDNPYINQENTCGFMLEFIGGEPFMAIDVIEQITDWVYQYMIETNHPWLLCFRVSICSNGTLYFNPKVQEYLNKYNRLISFSISIDGNQELHDSCRVFPDGSGSYQIAARAAHDWIAKNPNAGLGTKMTFSPQNIRYVFNAITNLITEFNFESILCNCCFEEGWTVEHARILYDQLIKVTDWLVEHDKIASTYISIFEETDFIPLTEDDNENWCGGTGNMIAVDYKGDIFPCLRYMESSIGTDVEPLIIGTVDGGIEETEKQRQCVKCLEAITRRSQSTDECWNCPIARGCAWCSGYNYQTFGTANKRATYICVMHKARALANAYYWHEYYRVTNDQEPRFKYNVPGEWAISIIGEEELDKLNRFLES